jgi:hypothetical protein
MMGGRATKMKDELNEGLADDTAKLMMHRILLLPLSPA